MEGNRHPCRLSRLGSGWLLTGTAVVPHAVNSEADSRAAASGRRRGRDVLDLRLRFDIYRLQLALQESDLLRALRPVFEVLLDNCLVVGVGQLVYLMLLPQA